MSLLIILVLCTQKTLRYHREQASCWIWVNLMHRFLECTSSRHIPWTQCATCCWRKHMRPLLMQVSNFYVPLCLENDLGFLQVWYIWRLTLWADEVCCIFVMEMKVMEVCHLIPLRQLFQAQILTAYLSEINFLMYSHLDLYFQTGLFSYDFYTKMFYVHFVFLMCAGLLLKRDTKCQLMGFTCCFISVYT